MNLSLILIILSLFVGYLLFDMFKKSRQQQQLAQVQSQTNASCSQLKVNGQNDANILKLLYDKKINSIKHKTISIHLIEDKAIDHFNEQIGFSIKELVYNLKQKFKIYLVIDQNKIIKNQIIHCLKQTNVTEIKYKTYDGAVAILRQLSCGTHLEGENALFKILKQYLSNIYLASAEKINDSCWYKNQIDMIFATKTLLEEPINPSP